jgi:hypothetical protein
MHLTTHPTGGPAMSFFIAATITVVTAVGLLVALIALLLQPNVEELIQGNWVNDASDAEGSAVRNG